MILLVSPESAGRLQVSSPAQGVSRLSAASNRAILDRIAAEPVDRVVVTWPAGAVNPFALARTLRRRHGPPVVLAGSLRPDTRFWAERNGCQLSESVEANLGTRGPCP